MWHRALLPTLLALLAASSAHAVPQTYFTWQQLTLQFSNLGRAEATATGYSLVVLETPSLTVSHLSTLSVFAQSLAATVPVTDPLAAPVSAVRFDLRNRPDLQGGGLIGNISGAIGTGASLTPNTLPMTGGVTLCLMTQVNCLQQLALPFGGTSAGAWIGHGVGGILTLGGTGTLRVSLLGAPYTVQTVSAPARTPGGGLDAITARGFAHGPASGTSSTAQTSGVLQIVTATHINTPGGTAPDISGSITTLLIHVMHIPEPRIGLLLGSGAALLAWLGWRRR